MVDLKLLLFQSDLLKATRSTQVHLVTFLNRKVDFSFRIRIRTGTLEEERRRTFERVTEFTRKTSEKIIRNNPEKKTIFFAKTKDEVHG